MIMHPNLKESDHPTCFGLFTNWEPIKMLSIYDFCEIIDPVFSEDMVISSLHSRSFAINNDFKLFDAREKKIYF